MTEDKMQYAVLQRKTEGRAAEFLSASHRTLNEKLIVTMQVCYQCKCTFPLRRGRKRCPHCEGTLRSKAIVPKSASFQNRIHKPFLSAGEGTSFSPSVNP